MKAFIVFALMLAGCRPMDMVAAPAPREAKPVVTEWTLRLEGGWRQETTFRSDGTCHSPQYGRGKWTRDGDTIYFSERDDTARYCITIDWESMSAAGATITDNGPVYAVQLSLRLGPKAID